MNNQNNTTQRVFTIIAETLGADIQDLTPESLLFEDLNAAPEDFAVLFERLEEEFSLTITPTERKTMASVGAIVTAIKDHLNELED